MRRLILLLTLLVASSTVDKPAAAQAPDETGRAKEAVMVLIRAEMARDGKYHIEDKATGKKLALDFKALRDEVVRAGDHYVVVGNFSEGSTPHEVTFEVSASGGDTGSRFQVTNFVLNGTVPPRGARFDKRPDGVRSSWRMEPGAGKIDEKIEPMYQNGAQEAVLPPAAATVAPHR